MGCAFVSFSPGEINSCFWNIILNLKTGHIWILFTAGGCQGFEGDLEDLEGDGPHDSVKTMRLYCPYTVTKPFLQLLSEPWGQGH